MEHKMKIYWNRESGKISATTDKGETITCTAEQFLDVLRDEMSFRLYDSRNGVPKDSDCGILLTLDVEPFVEH